MARSLNAATESVKRFGGMAAARLRQHRLQEPGAKPAAGQVGPQAQPHVDRAAVGDQLREAHNAPPRSTAAR